MPEGNPRCAVGRVLIIALFTMLKALVPKRVGSNSSSTGQKLTLVAKTPSNTDPSAMDGIQKTLSNLGLHLSWVFARDRPKPDSKGLIGFQYSSHKMGDLPNPSSIITVDNMLPQVFSSLLVM